MTSIKKQPKWRIMIAILIVATFFAPGIAGAFGGGRHHGQGFGMGGNGPGLSCGIWRNPQLVKDLGLSEDQVTKLKDLEYSQREKQLELRSQISALQLKMDKAMSLKPIDDGAVRDLAQKISALRGEKFNLKVESDLSLRKILTPDQVDKLNQYRMANRGKGHGQRNGKGGSGYGNENCPRNPAYRDDGRFMQE